MADLLERLRRSRGFDAREVLEAKLGRLARFFGESALDAAVVGVSGGVDSALVLALLRRLQRRGGMRIGIAAARELSIAGWRLNERIFAATELRVRDLPAYTRATFVFAGDDERLERLCGWHADRLQRLRPPP